MFSLYTVFCFFFFNDTATTEIYTLSLHDALPILHVHDGGHPDRREAGNDPRGRPPALQPRPLAAAPGDRKSTRLNSSHTGLSYAVFFLKKKSRQHHHNHLQHMSPSNSSPIARNQH